VSCTKFPLKCAIPANPLFHSPKIYQRQMKIHFSQRKKWHCPGDCRSFHQDCKTYMGVQIWKTLHRPWDIPPVKESQYTNVRRRSSWTRRMSIVYCLFESLYSNCQKLDFQPNRLHDGKLKCCENTPRERMS
jgi:hypothetical protein